MVVLIAEFYCSFNENVVNVCLDEIILFIQYPRFQTTIRTLVERYVYFFIFDFNLTWLYILESLSIRLI